MHRFDGAEQYFTRAVDFGYSFSIEETFEKWGRDEIIGDFVRLIRTIRPDVMLAHAARRHRRRPAPSGVGGHRARSVQARRRPDEVSRADRRRACVPWQPKKFYFAGQGFGGRGDAAAAGAACACRSTSRSTIRCSARPTPRSAPKRAACTSARAWRSCSRCRALRATSFQLVESTHCPADCTRDERRCSTASTPRSRAWRSSPAPRPPRELDDGWRRSQPPCRTRRSGSTTLTRRRARRCSRFSTGLRAVRVLRAQLRDDADRRRRRDSRSTSACARRSASSSRRFSWPTASASRRWPTTASSCPASRSACRSCVANRGAADVTSEQVSVRGLRRRRARAR